jgi:hypothetical protein
MDRPASNGGFHTLAVPDEWLEEPARVQLVYDDEVPQFHDIAGRPMIRPSDTASAPVRQRCGTRARSSRGRSVRVRGSRRSTAAAHSSSSDDPGLGDEPPEHRRVVA